ncbi:MAG: ribose 5-phosphate isomerase B [Bacteroidales bacterium]|jgi:ribose 5-phosphate isomerase B|nr:ribose 5-phosphate isomerase B [Candidatus Cloacimonadota bacterium]MDD2205241.1 ribose 5-phosphate isomerase B [Bacteroidales bacterium]MDD3085114.1 ribose 5-phosphate isomerase B [Candidatus ainarchaeum sp.]MDD3914401.1 ribose 5-phosphate isomerase B [Bacteroidales bacterium]MDD4634582.1 ribose 5-phosphate isomerase B [Bacteroidales bacterium]
MENENIIGLACDHAGYELKEKLKDYLTSIGFTVKDFGTNSCESVDYPDYIHPLASEINNGNLKKAIIICGTGNGVSMTANKYINVRAALCWNTEIAKLARQHNDANILALPARFISEKEATDILNIFLNTNFESGRHSRRIEKIRNIL